MIRTQSLDNYLSQIVLLREVGFSDPAYCAEIRSGQAFVPSSCSPAAQDLDPGVVELDHSTVLRSLILSLAKL